MWAGCMYKKYFRQFLFYSKKKGKLKNEGTDGVLGSNMYKQGISR